MNKVKKVITCVLFLLILVTGCFFAYLYLEEIGPFEKSPSLTLKGENSLELVRGEPFEEPGYVARDYAGKDISRKVQVKCPDLSETGEYEISYSITDHNVTVEKKRKITVEYEKPDPESPDYGHGIPVFMYHYVYDADCPPAKINRNFISDDMLEQQLQYLVDQDYYFPTWGEFRKYIDGEIDLPVKSVMLTFDDCSDGFLTYGVPLIEKYDVKATSFVICSKNGEEVAAQEFDHLTLQSHSYDMHKAGGSIGHGGIFTALTLEEGVADLEKSKDILGSGDAFAYPFGDYSDLCRQAVDQAGFLAAFTTECGKSFPGDDPLLLPRVRVEGNITMEQFIKELETEVRNPIVYDPIPVYFEDGTMEYVVPRTEDDDE